MARPDLRQLPGALRTGSAQVLDEFFIIVAVACPLMRSIMNQASRLLLLLVAASTLTAGCGSSAQPRVASAGGTPTIAPTANVIAAYVDGVRAWVGCLRGEGVKVSDPDTRGNVEFDGDKRLLKADPKFRAAQQKCLSLLPPFPRGWKRRLR